LVAALVGLALLAVVVAAPYARVVGVVVVAEVVVAVVGTLTLGGTVEIVNQTPLPILRLQMLILRVRRTQASTLTHMRIFLWRQVAMTSLHQSTPLLRLIWVTH
jgi:hypothetical protein